MALRSPFAFKCVSASLARSGGGVRFSKNGGHGGVHKGLAVSIRGLTSASGVEGSTTGDDAWRTSPLQSGRAGFHSGYLNQLCGKIFSLH